ncbi:MAG TPA: hypothetical protein VKP67_19900 [Xanthobacteraceae bacterium]|nr:hypothetical protein [Xanthobacteraceae bacterium]
MMQKLGLYLEKASNLKEPVSDFLASEPQPPTSKAVIPVIV